MTKAKKILAVLMCLITLLGVCSIAAGCPPKNDKTDQPKEEKYDVSIKIACKRLVDGRLSGPILEEYLFTSDIDEMHISRQYDGLEYSYYVYQYNLPDHPQWSGSWSYPKFDGPNTFQTFYGKVPQMYYEEDPKCICEKGEFYYKVIAHGADWNFRSINLYITVT